MSRQDQRYQETNKFALWIQKAHIPTSNWPHVEIQEHVTLHNQLMQCRVSIYQEMGIKEVALHSILQLLERNSPLRIS